MRKSFRITMKAYVNLTVVFQCSHQGKVLLRSKSNTGSIEDLKKKQRFKSDVDLFRVFVRNNPYLKNLFYEWKIIIGWFTVSTNSWYRKMAKRGPRITSSPSVTNKFRKEDERVLCSPISWLRNCQISPKMLINNLDIMKNDLAHMLPTLHIIENKDYEKTK